MVGARWRALVRLRPAAVASGLVLVLAGMLLAASAVTSGGADLRGGRATQLRDLVRVQSDRTQQHVAEVAALQGQVDALTSGTAGDVDFATARRTIAANAAAAGATPVTGSSVTVRLNDAPPIPDSNPLSQQVSPDDLVVHQQDVQAVVNALWRGGATAMQIMDQRVISTSAVRCVGNTLLLQGRVYSPPFVITAVGPVAGMRKSLEVDPGVTLYRGWAEVVGLGYEVTSATDTRLPAYEGSVAMRYASPAADASGTATPSAAASSAATSSASTPGASTPGASASTRSGSPSGATPGAGSPTAGR